MDLEITARVEILVLPVTCVALSKALYSLWASIFHLCDVVNEAFLLAVSTACNSSGRGHSARVHAKCLAEQGCCFVQTWWCFFFFL